MAALKESDNIPVMLVCEKQYIAMPMEVLVTESTVFKSMFSSNWKGAATVNPLNKVSYVLF